MTKPGERKWNQQKILTYSVTIVRGVLTFRSLSKKARLVLHLCVDASFIWITIISNCVWNVRGSDIYASQICVQVGQVCISIYLFIHCSHRYNFFNDVGLIFRWLLKERSTQSSVITVQKHVYLQPLTGGLRLRVLVLRYVQGLTSACHANAVVLSAAMRPAPRTAIVSPSSSTTFKSKSSLYFLLLTWRPERRF